MERHSKGSKSRTPLWLSPIKVRKVIESVVDMTVDRRKIVESFPTCQT